jgi:hypothetical protein
MTRLGATGTFAISVSDILSSISDSGKLGRELILFPGTISFCNPDGSTRDNNDTELYDKFKLSNVDGNCGILDGIIEE